MVNNKKVKKKRKVEKWKTQSERINEVNTIKNKLQKLGLSDQVAGIKDFFDICQQYIEEDHAWNGKIKLNGYKRILQGSLARRKSTACSINLKYDENI